MEGEGDHGAACNGLLHQRDQFRAAGAHRADRRNLIRVDRRHRCRHAWAIARLDRNERRVQCGQVVAAQRLHVAAGCGVSALAPAVDRFEHRVGQQDLVDHLCAAGRCEVAVRGDPAAVRALARTLVEQAVVAQFMTAGGSRAPRRQARRHRRAR
jgi:hypothetical protein